MTEPLRTDLNEFLFTPVAQDESGMHVTMLSALARSGADPWAEAASLAALSPQEATQRLELMLSKVANGPSPGDDTEKLATRLVAQLHAPPAAKLKPPPGPTAVARDAGPLTLSFSTLPRRVRLTIYSLLALILMGMAYRALTGGESANSGGISQHESQ